jgi:hypothetical protein
MTGKAKQIGATALGQILAGIFFVRVCAAADSGKGFLPVPGEVPAVVPVNRITVIELAPKTNPLPPPAAPVKEIHKYQPTTSDDASSSDWSTYYRERANKVLLDGKIMDRSTLTSLVGFLVKEHAELSNGTQIFTGAALDIAKRKVTSSNVATAMELRPTLWTNTNERVFLLNYKPAALPGALVMVFAQEIAPLEGWRTFKIGVEPSFEDWKRLTGR